MEYIAVFKQGGGCDYTLECGKTTIKLGEQKNIEEAYLDFVELYWKEYCGDGDCGDVDECELEEVTILEVTDMLDAKVEVFNATLQTRQKAVNETEEDTAERLEYIRLKDKFEEGETIDG